MEVLSGQAVNKTLYRRVPAGATVKTKVTNKDDDVTEFDAKIYDEIVVFSVPSYYTTSTNLPCTVEFIVGNTTIQTVELTLAATGGGGPVGDITIEDVTGLPEQLDELDGRVATLESTSSLPVAIVDTYSVGGYGLTTIVTPTHAVGDVLLVGFDLESTAIKTAPIGWMGIHEANSVSLFQRTAQTVQANYTMTATNSQQAYFCMALRGNNPQITVVEVAEGNTSSAQATFPYTTVVYVAVTDGSTAIGVPTGVIKDSDVYRATGSHIASLHSFPQGSIPARTFTNATRVITLGISQS